MSEARQLIVLFTVIFLIGIAGYLAAASIPCSGDLVVESYDVSVSPEGYLTETYLYGKVWVRDDPGAHTQNHLQ
jgi:hypothetical protein